MSRIAKKPILPPAAMEYVTQAEGNVVVYQSSGSSMAAPKRPAKNSQEAARNELLRRAVEVIGDEDAALRWMGTPVRALNYATPISLLHKESGFEAVRVVLGRLEHGVL